MSSKVFLPVLLLIFLNPAEQARAQGKVPGYLGSRFSLKAGAGILPLTLAPVAPKYDGDAQEFADDGNGDESHPKFMFQSELEWVAGHQGSIVLGWKRFRTAVNHETRREVGSGFGSETLTRNTLAMSSNNVFSLGWRQYLNSTPAPLGKYVEYTFLWGNGSVDMKFPDGETQADKFNLDEWGDVTWLGGEIKFGRSRIYMDHLVVEYGGHLGLLFPISSSISPQILQRGFQELPDLDDLSSARGGEFLLQYAAGFRVSIGYLP